MRTGTERLAHGVTRPEAYEEVTVRSGEAPIVLSIWRADPSEATVVFLPGTTTHPLFYEGFLDGLTREGFTAVGVHFREHGKSPRLGRPFAFEDLVRDAASALTYASRNHPGPLVVLGTSQGGMVAMALATGDHRPAAVLVHDALDPRLPGSVAITRYPNWTGAMRDQLSATMRLGARLTPGLPVPMDAFLDLDRVTRDPRLLRTIRTDPLGRSSYPLSFMASLLDADLSGMYDGSVWCPVVVIASTADPLLPFEYERDLYERIKAPAKELLVVASDRHLLLNECVSEALPRIAEAIRRHAVVPTLATAMRPAPAPVK
jgi:alpha-beta hydrolase superfamily lysophospholipase